MDRSGFVVDLGQRCGSIWMRWLKRSVNAPLAAGEHQWTYDSQQKGSLSASWNRSGACNTYIDNEVGAEHIFESGGLLLKKIRDFLKSRQQIHRMRIICTIAWMTSMIGPHATQQNQSMCLLAWTGLRKRRGRNLSALYVANNTGNVIIAFNTHTIHTYMEAHGNGCKTASRSGQKKSIRKVLDLCIKQNEQGSLYSLQTDWQRHTDGSHEVQQSFILVGWTAVKALWMV